MSKETNNNKMLFENLYKTWLTWLKNSVLLDSQIHSICEVPILCTINFIILNIL